MFNRIGTELELGDPVVALCRLGQCYDPDPQATQAQPFAYVVGDRQPGEHETFAEGLHLFINPWAETPVEREALPGITYHELEGNLIASSHWGGLQPISSRTFIFDQEHAHDFARYFHLRYLGLVPPLPEKDKDGNDSAEGAPSA